MLSCWPQVGKGSLLRALRRTIGCEFLSMVPLKLLNDTVQYINPILIHEIVHIIENDDRSTPSLSTGWHLSLSPLFLLLGDQKA